MAMVRNITSKITSLLLLASINILVMQLVCAGDIEQILPLDSNFTIDGDGSLEVMRVQSNGLVGIGTTMPNEKLEVNGHIRMTDGNEAANTIMIGDAVGRASWADISTIQDGIGTDDQQLQSFILNGSYLNLTLENGGTKTVNLSDFNNSTAIIAVQNALTTRMNDVNSSLATHVAADSDTNATNEIQDLAYDTATNVLTITNNSSATDINLSALNNATSIQIPFISDTAKKIIALSTTTSFILNGSNFTPNTTVSIVNPPFPGTINAINVLNPNKIEVNITTPGTTGIFDIIVSNSGILNTQWSGNGVGLLQVSNNNGQTQAASGLTCKTLLDDGFSTGDGLYWIDPDGGSTVNAFQVYCDMTSDGGGWTLVFRHDTSGGFFANISEADSFNVASPGITTKKYSILNKIGSIKNASAYEFRLYYPTINKRNHWKQTFDPRSGQSPTRPVAGYIPISIDASGSFWGGIDRDTSGNTFLDGSVNHGNWWYSLGSKAVYAGGIPGPSVVVNLVELYIR